LFFADLFDTMGLHPGRIIAVDIDHSNLHSLPKSHPRITWIEEDAVHAFDQVAGLIDPIHDTVMVIEDASHKYQHTLEIMRRYGTLVRMDFFFVFCVFLCFFDFFVFLFFCFFCFFVFLFFCFFLKFILSAPTSDPSLTLLFFFVFLFFSVFFQGHKWIVHDY